MKLNVVFQVTLYFLQRDSFYESDYLSVEVQDKGLVNGNLESKWNFSLTVLLEFRSVGVWVRESSEHKKPTSWISTKHTLTPKTDIRLIVMSARPPGVSNLKI
jgi:hypothetical protein